MGNHFLKALEGYQKFRRKYALGDQSVMESLSDKGQQPDILVVACCDSRVDPAVILQCDPGDLFVIRNVANIVPPNEADQNHHGTSAALEFGVRFLKVSHLILLGHSQCGGIQTRINNQKAGPDAPRNDFINHWVSLIQTDSPSITADECAKLALHQSHQNCLTFPWIATEVENKNLTIHRWFFDIKMGQIFTHSGITDNTWQPLESNESMCSLK